MFNTYPSIPQRDTTESEATNMALIGFTSVMHVHHVYIYIYTYLYYIYIYVCICRVTISMIFEYTYYVLSLSLQPIFDISSFILWQVRV